MVSETDFLFAFVGWDEKEKCFVTILMIIPSFPLILANNLPHNLILANNSIKNLFQFFFPLSYSINNPINLLLQNFVIANNHLLSPN